MILGAIEVVAKPKFSLGGSLEEASAALIAAVRTAAKANMAAAKPKALRSIAPIVISKKLTADAMLAQGNNSSVVYPGPLVAIGASTGGTQALEFILTALPANTHRAVYVRKFYETIW